MYRPRRSVEDRPDVLLQIGFATIVTPTAAGIEATHVPTIARQSPDGRLILAAHVARTNAHWRVPESSASLAIFQGPHTYMSPQ